MHLLLLEKPLISKNAMLKRPTKRLVTVKTHYFRLKKNVEELEASTNFKMKKNE